MFHHRTSRKAVASSYEFNPSCSQLIGELLFRGAQPNNKKAICVPKMRSLKLIMASALPIESRFPEA